VIAAPDHDPGAAFGHLDRHAVLCESGLGDLILCAALGDPCGEREPAA
jgi:hypothetical protein